MFVKKRLIYASRVKQLIRDKVKTMRPGWDCKLISKSAIDQLEANFRAMIIRTIQAHPTVGKTFKEVY